MFCWSMTEAGVDKMNEYMGGNELPCALRVRFLLWMSRQVKIVPEITTKRLLSRHCCSWMMTYFLRDRQPPFHVSSHTISSSSIFKAGVLFKASRHLRRRNSVNEHVIWYRFARTRPAGWKECSCNLVGDPAYVCEYMMSRLKSWSVVVEREPRDTDTAWYIPTTLRVSFPR